MTNIKRTGLAIAILMLSLTWFSMGPSGAGGVAKAESLSTTDGGREEYISDVMIASGTSEEAIINRIREAGYTPIMKNITAEKPELASPYVYLGYRTTTDPAESLENREAGSTGSVFGDSALMIGGIAMIVGVVVGMISMKIRPRKTDPKERGEVDS